MDSDVSATRRRTTRRIMDYLVMLTVVVGACTASMMGDECDWTGSGLSTSSTGRGVTPVYLRCTAGRVKWLYPHGAIRILLRLPAGDREFRACIKVRGDSKNRLAARLFLEGPRSLLPLYSENDGGSKSLRCFQSKNGQAAIYVEALENDGIHKRVADIEYDLEPLPRGGKGYDPAEECRPCTGEELAHAFCTSDLVTRGIIRAVENGFDSDVSEMNIKITKLIRHTTEDGYSNDVGVVSSNVVGDDLTKEVVVHVPRHCGVSHGVGEFVFMARKKLGDLTLQCAPRLEDWAHLVRSLTEEGKAHCVLRS